MSTVVSPVPADAPAKRHLDPYALDPADIEEPPTEFSQIVRRIGPGIVLSASIVGSGELIATTTLGAKVGYTMLWLIILSCLIKSVVQSPGWMTVLLWLGAIVITVFVIPALYLELMKMVK